MAFSVLRELGELSRTRPAADAPDSVVAEWYRHKADLLDHLAAEGDPLAAEQAEEARAHLATLAWSGGSSAALRAEVAA